MISNLKTRITIAAYAELPIHQRRLLILSSVIFKVKKMFTIRRRKIYLI